MGHFAFNIFRQPYRLSLPGMLFKLLRLHERKEPAWRHLNDGNSAMGARRALSALVVANFGRIHARSVARDDQNDFVLHIQAGVVVMFLRWRRDPASDKHNIVMRLAVPRGGGKTTVAAA